MQFVNESSDDGLSSRAEASLMGCQISTLQAFRNRCKETCNMCNGAAKKKSEATNYKDANCNCIAINLVFNYLHQQVSCIILYTCSNVIQCRQDILICTVGVQIMTQNAP